MPPRRLLLRMAAGVALDVVGAGTFIGLRARADDNRVIPIEARRYRYTPNEIRLHKGETVTLAFTAIDFVHGFSAPDFGVRSDLLPGRVTSVTIAAKAPGRYTFLCDNFCGDHHEDMNGTFIVE